MRYYSRIKENVMFSFLLCFIFLFCFTLSQGWSLELTGAGATFPQPVLEAWAYQYYKETKIKINYQGIGSGGGIRQAKSRTVDFGASDKPLKSSELRKYNLAQFPEIIGAVVITYNLPLHNKTLRLDGRAICDIYLGKIKNWNNPYLKKLNPDINLPDLPIIVVHRSEGSGTTWLFTTYLSKVCSEWKNKIGAGKSVNWPVGIGAKGNPGVTNYVKQTLGAIGYVEYTYAMENHLPMAILKNRSGNFVKPSVKTMKAAAFYAKWSIKKDFYADLTYQPGRDSYPITGASYILLIKDNPKTKEVTKFFKWAFENGDEIAKKLHYIPLPKNLKSLIYKYWKIHKVYPY